MKILITSGGTQIPIDSVRHIGNMSSGYFGSELAREFLKAGHQVMLLRHRNAHSPMKVSIDFSKEESILNFQEISRAMIPLTSMYYDMTFVTYEDYSKSAQSLVSTYYPDLTISLAAVSDYGVEQVDGKISSKNGVDLHLTPLPKVLPKLKEAYPKTVLVGAKLLVNAGMEHLREAAQATMNQGCDMVLGNDLVDIRAGNRKYILFLKDGSMFHLTDENLTKQVMEALISNMP